MNRVIGADEKRQERAFNVAAMADRALMQAARNQIDLLLETGASFEEVRTALDKVLADHRGTIDSNTGIFIPKIDPNFRERAKELYPDSISEFARRSRLRQEYAARQKKSRVRTFLSCLFRAIRILTGAHP